MAEETPRFGLGTFEPGEPWDHTDVVELVDQLAVERGPFSDRPNAGDYDGETYLAEDRATLYEWDDDAGSWNAVAGLGTSANPTPTAHREAVEVGEATIGDDGPVTGVSDHTLDSNGVLTGSGNRVTGQLNEPLGVDVQAAAGENAQINVTAPEGEIWLVDHITANAEISGSTTGTHSIQYHATDNSNGETIVFIIEAAHDAFGAYIAPTTIGGTLNFGDSFEAVQRAISGTIIDDTEGVRVRYTNNTDAAFDSSGDDTFSWTFYGARLEA